MTADKLFQCLFSKSKNAKFVPVTYEELISLMQESKLVPGVQYRIIDFVTTFSQDADITSAGHVFDIVVTALTENVLSEDCGAMKNDNDNSGYFDNSNLTTWRLKYTVNPSSNITWYPAQGGKGYIYEMADEFGNVAPYDFKNVLYTNGIYTFCKEQTVSDVTSYVDASLTDACSNNTIKFITTSVPNCFLFAESIKGNNITGQNINIIAKKIECNTINSSLETTASWTGTFSIGVEELGTYKVKDIVDNTITCRKGLTIEPANNSSSLYNNTINVITSNYRYISLNCTLEGCNIAVDGNTNNISTSNLTAESGTKDHVTVIFGISADTAISLYYTSTDCKVRKIYYNRINSEFEYTDGTIDFFPLS